MEIGAPERIRTSDPQIRSLVLYPAELRARGSGRTLLKSGKRRKGWMEREGPSFAPQASMTGNCDTHASGILAEAIVISGKSCL